jgi:hypothetical protein
MDKLRLDELVTKIDKTCMPNVNCILTRVVSSR